MSITLLYICASYGNLEQVAHLVDSGKLQAGL